MESLQISLSFSLLCIHLKVGVLVNPEVELEDVAKIPNSILACKVCNTIIVPMQRIPDFIRNVVSFAG